MSASPADRTPGGTPQGTKPKVIKRKSADPMVKPVKRKPRPLPATSNGTNGTQQAGSQGSSQGGLQSGSQGVRRNELPPKLSQLPRPPSPPGGFGGLGYGTSGFTAPNPKWEYVDYPVVLSKKALGEQLRLHVARFASKRNIDPSDEKEFTRPVRLQRRDPRAPPGGAGYKEDGDVAGDDPEREAQMALRAERQAQKEAIAAEIAPSANGGHQKRAKAFQKKTNQVYRKDQTPEQIAAAKLRHEETLQWHLEDFDNKQTWVADYEAALSETHAMMTLVDGKFIVTPLEKWYKFQPKQHFKVFTTEEAEKHMNTKATAPKWLMKYNDDQQVKKEEEAQRNAGRSIYKGKSDSTGDTKIASFGRANEGGDELDYEEDRFADDEENPVLEGDAEDAKEADERIKRDQLQANIFGLKDEKDYDKAEQMERAAKQRLKVEGKTSKKGLIKREHNYIYDSDSDDPYATESSSDSSTARGDDNKKDAEDAKIKKESTPSTSTKGGTNTPAHRAGSTKPNLKRASPSASDASGNESSAAARKKAKHKHQPLHPSNLNPAAATNNAPSRTGTPVHGGGGGGRIKIGPPGGGSSLPTAGDFHKGKPKRPRGGGAGSGSDGEAAASGGEMSDGTRKRIKLNVPHPGSRAASGQPSRAQSPDAVAGGRRSPLGGAGGRSPVGAGSRAGSPGAPPNPNPNARPSSPLNPTTTTTNPTPNGPTFPTLDELRAAIPKEGRKLNVVLGMFKTRGAQTNEGRGQLARLLKAVSRYDKTTELLFPLRAGEMGS